MIAGLDIGNGLVKAKIDGENINLFSGCCRLTNPTDVKASPEEAKVIIDDIFNQADVSFDTVLMSDTGRRIFGERAIKSGKLLEEFDVSSRLSKVNQTLSSALVLFCIAGKALQDYYKENKKLPTDTVYTDVNACLALPIGEYMRNKETYATRFLDGSHIVTFHNFENLVRVQVKFNDVSVLAEGQAGILAIKNLGVPFADALLSSCRKAGFKLDGVVGNDIYNATDVIGIDIGEGTVNFCVFSNGSFNTDASITINNGYGFVLENALEKLETDGYGFKSRKELSEFLKQKETPLNRKRLNNVKARLASDLNIFVNEIVSAFRRVLSKVGMMTEVIYVYGGGATPLEKVLYPELKKVSEDLGDEYPILYLDSSFSSRLNSHGLYVYEKEVVEK